MPAAYQCIFTKNLRQISCLSVQWVDRVDNERLVLGIVGSEYIAKQTVVTKLCDRLAKLLAQ